MEETMDRIKEHLSDGQRLYEAGVERGRELAQRAADKSTEAFGLADDWVQNNAWLALGIATGIGFLLGLVIASSFRPNAEKSVSQ